MKPPLPKQGVPATNFILAILDLFESAQAFEKFMAESIRRGDLFVAQEGDEKRLFSVGSRSRCFPSSAKSEPKIVKPLLPVGTVVTLPFGRGGTLRVAAIGVYNGELERFLSDGSWTIVELN